MGTGLPARILIVRLGALGDVVNALALANALVRARPDVELGWASYELAGPILVGHPALRRVHLIARSSGLRGWRELISEIRAQRYELALDLQRLTKSALLTRLSGAPRRIGFDRARTKEQSWIWHSERLAPADAARPMAQQALDFARHLGVQDTEVVLKLPLNEQAERWAESWTDDHTREPVLLNLGATKSANRWPAAHWGALARRLHAELGCNVALTGGRGDQQLAALVRRAGGEHAIDMVGKTDLAQLIALQRRAKLVVTCDTGPMHTAAAVGAPLLALFGAADERRTGPYGQLQHVLRRNPPCSPCGKRDCPLPRHVCMLELDADSVFEAARTRLLS
jgi:lipopolysaccharide heptosyltransferase II